MNIDLINKDDAELADAASKNTKHYKHACSKHKLFVHFFSLPYFHSEYNWESALKRSRERLALHIEGKVVSTYDVLACELCEIYDAYERGDLAQAREEIRDAIAVLERMDDWLIAEQKKKDESK